MDVLPQDLPEEFSNKELGQALQISTARARTITYTLREAGIIHQAGKRATNYCTGAQTSVSYPQYTQVTHNIHVKRVFCVNI